MATAANTAGGKSDGGNRNDATAAVPPPVQAGSAWPRALRIDVELAENHARRRRGAGGGFGRIDAKNRPQPIPTRPSKQPSERYRNFSLAEGCGGGDERTWKVGAAGRRVDVAGLAESNARAEGPADLTRSTGRRSILRGSKIPKNVAIDGEDMNRAAGDGAAGDGGAGGGGTNGDRANDAGMHRSAGNRRFVSKAARHSWADQEGAAIAGGGEAAVTTGADISSESREDQGRMKRFRRGGMTEGGQEEVRFCPFWSVGK